MWETREDDGAAHQDRRYKAWCKHGNKMTGFAERGASVVCTVKRCGKEIRNKRAERQWNCSDSQTRGEKKETRPRGAYTSSISFSWRAHDSHANHIIVRSWRTSSFHAIDWFCSRNSRVRISHRSMFSGLTKSHATLMQSARLHTCVGNCKREPPSPCTRKPRNGDRHAPDAHTRRG